MKKGFTLVEILMSIVVFGLVMAAAGGAFYGIYNDWRRQRNYLECIENARWAMEFMSSELSQGGNASVSSVLGIVEILRFEIDTDVINPPAPDARVWYWRGITVGPFDYGRRDTLYRGVDTSLQINPVLSFLAAYAHRQKLTNFIVANPSGHDIFSDAGGGLYTIELTVRPRPDEPAGRDNRNYTLRTKIRPRN